MTKTSFNSFLYLIISNVEYIIQKNVYIHTNSFTTFKFSIQIILIIMYRNSYFTNDFIYQNSKQSNMSQENDSNSMSWEELLETPPQLIFDDYDSESISSNGFQDDEVMEYIQPSTFDFLDEIELTENEKIEKQKKTQEIQDNRQNGTYVCKLPGFVPDSIKFEYYFNEVASRCLMISNIPAAATKEDLLFIFNRYGAYETCDLSNISKGIATVQFYNLEHAQEMRVSTIYIRGYQIMMIFHIEQQIQEQPSKCNSKKKSKKNQKNATNNGTIVLFNLPLDIDEKKLNEIFSQFGKIREIRGTPSKATQKFIEFYDKRCAAKALKSYNGKPIVKDSHNKISIEFSFPGCYKKNIEKYYKTTLPTIERRNNNIVIKQISC